MLAAAAEISWLGAANLPAFLNVRPGGNLRAYTTRYNQRRLHCLACRRRLKCFAANAQGQRTSLHDQVRSPTHAVLAR